MQKEKEREIMETAMLAGEILLENGAEIFRVEDTVKRICTHYGMHSGSTFVLTNGIFVTSGNAVEETFARVRQLPVRGANLDKVAAVNQLSREIVEGRYTVGEARDMLEEIKKRPGKSKKMLLFAAGMSAACFCHMFGGNLTDSAAAFLAGVLVYLFILLVGDPWLSKIVTYVAGGAIVTLTCAFLSGLYAGSHMNEMIIGAMMPLVPGLAFTNGIRDLANGDYLSGSVRLLDAMLVFLCIAVGAGLAIDLFNRMTGGALL